MKLISGFAIAYLVLGGFVPISFLFGVSELLPLAIFFGAIAINQTRRSSKYEGLCPGIIELLIIFVIPALFFFTP